MNRLTHRYGSIYLITLITVAAIVSMVLIGVRLRLATTGQSQLIEQMSEGNTGVLDATEYALQKITDDADWNTTAQSGKIFADFRLGDLTYSSSVVDAATGITPTAGTTTYRVQVASDHSTVHSAAQIEVICKKVDYAAALDALSVTHYWAFNEAWKSSTAIETVDGCDGAYLDPNGVGTGTNTEGGLVPVFADAVDYVQVPHCRDFNRMAEGTISLWMNLSGTGSFTTYGVFGKKAEKNQKPAINLSLFNGSVAAYLTDTEAYQLGNFAVSGSGVITVGQWHHVAVSWGANGLTVHVDGVQVANNSSNTESFSGYGGHWSADLHIGSGYVVLPTSQPDAGFVGSIAHFAILPTQLNDAQLVELAAIKPDLSSTAIVDDSWVRVFE